MVREEKLRRFAAVVVFLIVIWAVLSITGKIVRAKFIGDSTTIVNGFYAEKKNDIDLLVLGSSNSFCTINPLVLYEQYGIAAYDFGSSSQPLNITVLYLKEAFRRQKPKVVALEINMIVGDSLSGGYESGLRWGLTDMPLSIDKLKCIYQSVGAVNAEYFSYVFPIFRYHNRWKEISKIDYTYDKMDKTNYTKGYLETQSVTETEVNLADYQAEGTSWIEQENMRYLDEIAALCKKNGAELLLFKSPKEGWYQYDTKAVRALAIERGLNFVDYNELYAQGALELDTRGDFRDNQHLNDFGAAKVSAHFGSYIQEHYALSDRREESERLGVENAWDAALRYKKRSGQQEFMAAQTAKDCLELLQNDKDYVLIVTETNVDNSGKVQQWVYEDKRVVWKQFWEKDGVAHRKIGDSELVLAKLGAIYQVLIDGVEQYQAGSKWNIVVYDKVTKSVSASFAFDR